MIGMTSKPIVMWGIGAIGMNFLQKKWKEIDYIVDTDCNRHGEKLCYKGKTWVVKSPEDFYDKRVFWVISVKEQFYIEIKSELQNRGKAELHDFCKYDLFQKKLVLIYGNCHMLVIRNVLMKNADFLEQYGIYCIEPICSMKEPIDEGLLKVCDVFIHQDIRRDNIHGIEYSDEYLLPKLKTGCVNITVPNLYGYGRMFSPGFRKNERKDYLSLLPRMEELFPVTDEKLYRCVHDDMPYEEIVSYLLENPYSEEEILCNFNERMQALMKREKNWDFPMSQFILSNYKSHKLFYENFHPTNYVLAYITHKLLLMLGIPSNLEKLRNKMYGVDELDRDEVFVYPCVMKTLGMHWDNSCIREFYPDRRTHNLSFEKYIQEFIAWEKE